MPAEDAMPSTVERSGDKVQRTWGKAHGMSKQELAEAINRANVAETARARGG